MRVSFERKPDDLRGSIFEPEKVITLDWIDWYLLVNNPLLDQPWIDQEYTKYLCYSPDGDGCIAVDTQGAKYARYAARLS